jgi:hypothetical protein
MRPTIVMIRRPLHVRSSAALKGSNADSGHWMAARSHRWPGYIGITRGALSALQQINRV